MTNFDPSVHPGHPGISRRHLPGLDGVRGLAIAMVMFGHFIVVGKNLQNLPPGIPVPILLPPSLAFSRLLQSGYLGVDLFFVLSGFLITGILLDSKSSENYFSVFYVRRALRIFPLYYALLAVSWLTVLFITPGDRALLTGEDSMLWNWLYASNIGMAVKDDWLTSPTWVGLGHFWSLAVEEQFYFVWPLLVFLVPVKILRRICVTLVLASPLIFWMLPHWLGESTPGHNNPAAYVSTLGRLGVLAAGAWLAIVWRTPGAWESIKPKLVPIAIISGIVLLLERSFLPILSGCEPSIVLVLGSACVGLAAGGGGAKRVHAFFESRVLRWLGKYSYAIYVYHHALKPVWIAYLWEKSIVPVLGTGWPATLCYTAAASAASLLLAWLSWICFEGPILSLKSRSSYRFKPVLVPGAIPSSAK